MKYRWFWLVAVILSFWFCRTAMKEAHDQLRAQSSGTLSGNGPHTNCTTPAAGSYFLCLATDGVWVSNNGAAYFQIVAPTAQVAGVTSFNGQTGVVTYTPPAPPVTSVQGKTGAVVLNGTTTVAAPALSISSTGGLIIAAPAATTTVQ